jgi:hypothetical protein
MMSHINRMCSAMSCGIAVGRPRDVRLRQASAASPAVHPFFPAFSIRCSTSRTESRYSSSFRWSFALICRRKSVRVAQHRVEHALVAALHFVLEQPVERERRDKSPAASESSAMSTKCAKL